MVLERKERSLPVSVIAKCELTSIGDIKRNTYFYSQIIWTLFPLLGLLGCQHHRQYYKLCLYLFNVQCYFHWFVASFLIMFFFLCCCSILHSEFSFLLSFTTITKSIFKCYLLHFYNLGKQALISKGMVRSFLRESRTCEVLQ